ncbi:DNA (cytosine-5)-methyltransferase 3A-like [Aphidius gifuensis]|nr:DNA (cytosine-5)-methyltransferase 3A-like [Aphidius gifuensis]
MLEDPVKIWIFWLGEGKISQLKNTQVKIFYEGSTDRLADILNGKTRKLGHSFDEMIKELGERLNDKITKPYETWSKRIYLKLKNHDDIIFYPYPLEIKNKLDQLKLKNKELNSNKSIASQALNKQKSNNKKLKIDDKKSSSVNKQNDKSSTDVLHLKFQKIGTIVWGKIAGQIWWPGVITDYHDCGMQEPKFGCQWIMWYGDYTLSQVNHKCIMNFEKGIKKLEPIIKQSKRDVYKKGIFQASLDYCEFYGVKTEGWTLQSIFDWSKKPKSSRVNLTKRNLTTQLLETIKYSQKIQSELKKHITKCTTADVREHDIKNSSKLELVKVGKANINELCLMCLENYDESLINHPYFDGKLCQVCLVKYKPTIFAYDDDGKCFFCTVCAGTDTVVMCGNPDCPRVYCMSCLKYLISPKSYKKILKCEPWNCYLCETNKIFIKSSIIKPRIDWKNNIFELFKTSHETMSSCLKRFNNKKNKIRVLSLFDGISTGFLALNKLGLDVECYYASEIDPDAELVSLVNNGNLITRLGDVRNITEEKIRQILPIDLLIGGSPCNDLSLVNPKRRGLHDPNGTGVLFFEFCRIKKILETLNIDRHLFWMFENVASMPEEYKQDINKNLGCEPDLIDSSFYSPQHRPRYYWNNIPLSNSIKLSKDLQDVLAPNCNRYALVKKIRTVTTQLKSLKQGTKALKPVLMNEEYDCLWTTELEEIFSLPRHYTDVNNLSATKRQKLIGQSWCVQTITEILRPLCHFFTQINS